MQHEMANRLLFEFIELTQLATRKLNLPTDEKSCSADRRRENNE